MSLLCSLCSSIPFASLPELPPYSGFSLIGNRNNLVSIWFEEGQGLPAGHALGFPWHPDLRALVDSAKSCPLCELVQQGLREWWTEYDEISKSDKMFAMFGEHYQRIPEGQQLWIAKRPGGAPGFHVVVREDQASSKVYVLLGVAIFAEADSVPAKEINLRPVDPDSGSKHSLDKVKSWYTNCAANHKHCGSEYTTLPSRVLDITAPDGIIKLVDGTTRSGKYASLSYCWGEGQKCTTRKDNLMARKDGFQLSELPKTFTDAITVAKHLGLDYLWIDSLCICQDDEEDWARESARMTTVYSNAHVVIAADHAKNNTVGCFHERPSRPEVRLQLPEPQEQEATDGITSVIGRLLLNGENSAWNRGALPHEPLSSRAWALQERLLAQRVVHYATTQLHFECTEGLVSEDGHHIPRFCQLRDQDEGSTFGNASRDLWNAVLWNYGKRQMTKPTDKMPALSGLARLFEEQMGAKYVAGLWSDDLIEGLCWQGLGAAQRPGYLTGPSWSWATYEGIAATGARGTGMKDIAEILEWHVEPKFKSNPFGEISDAWIRIRAPMALLVPSPVASTEHEEKLRRIDMTPFPRFCTHYSVGSVGSMCTFDNRPEGEPQIPEGKQLWAMMLGGYPKKNTSESKEQSSTVEAACNFSRFYCLVVTRVDGVDDVERFERVGWMFLDDEHNNEATRIKDDDESWQSITLV